MGLFDFFLSEDKKISKHQRQLTNRDSQAEDRELSAHLLAELGTPKALLALLTRFDMKLEHHLNDQAEKEVVYALLVNLGDAAVRSTKVWLKQCKSVSVPLRLLSDLEGDEKTQEYVFELLERELAKDDFKPARKAALLVWMAERKHPEAVQRVAPFLKDFDEGVRCLAAEVLISQGDDSVAAILLTALTNPKEDSNRLRHRIVEVFVARGWTVEDEASLMPVLPAGYTVQGNRIASV